MLRPRNVVVALALATCALLALATPAFAATYDPLNVIPYDTWRASSSMTASDIQTFLDALPGPLKTLDAALDHNDVRMPASRIVWEAAQASGLNPKVILATLQKEQSLLTYYVGMPQTRTRADGTHYTHYLTQTEMSAIYKKAMGYGITGARDPVTGDVINPFSGLGEQIWHAAFSLSSGRAISGWYPGEKIWVDNKTREITPANASTFALYTYTPYYPQKLVWDVYTRYFGDPAAPARLRPVYRFRNLSSSTYYYTTSEATRYSLVTKSSHTWAYGGVSFTIDTSSTANTKPLYRFRNTTTGRYTYTAYASTRNAILRTKGWVAAGTVGFVSQTTGAPVYRMENKATRAILYTRFKSSVTKLTTGTHANFLDKGVAFHLGTSAPTLTPVGP